MNSFFTASIFALLFSQSPAQERDLSGYEKMEFTIEGTKESGEPYAVKEREFIWNCWKQKRRCFAYLKSSRGAIKQGFELLFRTGGPGGFIF